MAVLQTEWGQNWIARQITTKLSKDLQTKITIKHVNFALFNKMDLEGVYVEDQKHDTLLYAGILQVRITDFFFFKDKAEVKYIGLKDAIVNFNRTDSTWNYNFLADYFSSSPSKNKEPEKKAGIQFNLKKVVLENVAFIKKDAWGGNDIVVKVGGLDMNVNDLSLSKQNFDVADLTLVDPYFSTYDYTPKFISTPGTTHAAPDWTIAASNINITNGTFKLDNGTLSPAVSYFDGKHIDFNRINGNIKNFHWQNDIISGNVALSTKERSGLDVKSLQTTATIEPGAMIFNKLFLQTNSSTISNSFSMRFDKNKGMGNFEHDVIMEADLDKAFVTSSDIAFFAPGAKNWNRNIKINGHVKGTVDALAGDDLKIWAGNDTYIAGNVSLVGLPDIDRTLMNIDAKELRTTYADAAGFIPSIKNIQTPNLKKLTYLHFKGTYTGFVNDFVTYGTLETPLGTLVTDLNMKFPKGGEPVYSGSLSTNGFQLGQFVNSDHLGIVDFSGNVKGSSFNWQKLNMTLDGTIRRIKYDDYTYQNITTKGTFNKKKFNGDFVIKDPNADLHVNGLIDLSGVKPLFDATAQIEKANFKELQLTNDEFNLKGNFKLNLQASSWEDLLGTARISDATLLHNGTKLSFDSLYVHADSTQGGKTLKVSSNEFDATVVGDFDLKSLPKAFTLFLSRYYPSYITAPVNIKPQTFTFDINTGIVDDYVKLINPNLSGFNNSRISGALNVAANTMDIDADVPHFAFKKYNFSDVKLKGSGDLQRLLVTGQVMNATIDSNTVFPETNFTIQAQNDVSDITLKTTSSLAINQANLSARIRTFSDGASVVVNPSTFVLNGKTWSIDQGGELNFRKNSVVQGQLVLRESQQEIVVQTIPSSIGDWNDLHVTLRSLNLGDLSPFIFKENHLEGTLSGDIMIEDPIKRFLVSSTLHTDGLKLDADSLGKVDASITYDNTTGILSGKGSNVDPEHHIPFELSLNLKSPINNTNRISLHPSNFQLKYLERFIGTIFSNIQGYVTGDIDVFTGGAYTDVVAKARLHDAGFIVNFTKVFYHIEDTEIELKKDLLEFKKLRLKDTLGGVAEVNGTIKHEGFKNMDFDIYAKILSPDMLLLNTTYKDNQTFYGTARGSGEFFLKGPQNDLYMRIIAQASETAESNITLPPSNTRESGMADFMVEKKYGVEMTPTVLRGAATNINYEVDITATPKVNMQVILDELTGDIIRGRGTGHLKITSGSSAPLTINGRYNIDEGNYLFTFQSLFKKPFVLRKGANNYIEWERDPYAAKVNLEAVYTAENVSFAPLASYGNLSDLSRLRDNVNVVAKLTGDLFHPKFDFKLEFPSNGLIYSRPDVAFGLQQVQKNTNELNKQVTYLIVFNSFAPYESAQSIGTRPFEEFTYSTLSGLVSNELNKQLNQLFSRIFRNNKNLTLNFTGSLYNKDLIDPNAKGIRLFNQVASNISLGSSFFNGRAIFTVGGTLDVPLQNTFQQNIQLLPDVTLEILLNQTGSLRATFFYRQNIDYIYGATTAGSPTTKRYGTGISYNKEFDTIGEWLLGQKKKKQKKDSLPPQPVDSTGSK